MNAHRQQRSFFAVILCSLLFLFAFNAKTALYSNHPDEVKSLTSTKVWNNVRMPANAPTQVSQIPQFLSLVLLLLMVGFVLSDSVTIEPLIPLRSNWFSPRLSVRPPPSL